MRRNIDETMEETADMRQAVDEVEREKQMVYLATKLAEKQLREGTASAQVIVHYLKLGSSMTALEKEGLELQNEHTKAKTKAVASSENSEAKYEEAIAAFKRYSGNINSSGDDYDENLR